MAKKAASFRNNIIRERTTQTLSTLADQTAIAFGKLTMEEDWRRLKTELTCRAHGFVDDELGLEGGLLLGITLGNYTMAEVAEALIIDGPVGPNDPKQEKASRWIHIIGSFKARPFNPNVTGVTMGGAFVGKDGSPIIVDKLPWTFSNSNGWQYFVFNNTGSALASGGLVGLLATHYGVWVV